MTYPKCEDCKNFRAGLPHDKKLDVVWLYGDDYKHKCNLTGRSTAWERASKLSTIKRMNGQGPDRLIAAVHDNCGMEGQFFKAKIRSEVA